MNTKINRTMAVVVVALAFACGCANTAQTRAQEAQIATLQADNQKLNQRVAETANDADLCTAGMIEVRAAESYLSTQASAVWEASKAYADAALASAKEKTPGMKKSASTNLDKLEADAKEALTNLYESGKKSIHEATK
jgi:hypothetical protein